MKRTTTGLVAIAVLGLALGCGKDSGDQKDNGSGAAGQLAWLGSGASQMPAGAISTGGSEANVLADTKTDWKAMESASSADAKTPAPAAPAGAAPVKLDPSSISTAGIPATMSGFSAVKTTGFRVAYGPTTKYARFRDAFMREKIFENVATYLNKTIKLPRVVDIHLVDCGTVNAFYDPKNSRIIMCYELMDYYTKMFQPVSKTNEELGNSIVGATFFAFFHELGHGLIHQLELPAVGREEDSVDQMATLILMEGGDQGVGWAMAGARWFALQAEANKKSGVSMPFWDEHSMEEQRFYNISCLIFGSAPGKYGPMVKNGYLPEKRARRCSDEYGKISKAWEKLLEPHMQTPSSERSPEQPVATNTGGNSPAPGNTNQTGQQPNAGGGPLAPKPLPGPAEKMPSAPSAPSGPRNQAPPEHGRDEHALGCDHVVEYALKVAGNELHQQAQQMGPEAIAQLEREWQANIPLVRKALIQQCNAGWTPKQRACVLRAKSIAQADACGIK